MSNNGRSRRDDGHRRSCEARRHPSRLHGLARDEPGARQPVRRRDRRPPVHPRRSGARQGDAVRRHDRPRVPDASRCSRPVSQQLLHVSDVEDGRQLRARPGPLPGSSARRRGSGAAERRSPRSPRSPAASRCKMLVTIEVEGVGEAGAASPSRSSGCTDERRAARREGRDRHRQRPRSRTCVRDRARGRRARRSSSTISTTQAPPRRSR